MLDLASSFLVLTALMAYLNHRFLKLPPTVGVMGLALLLATTAGLLRAAGFDELHQQLVAALRQVDFSDVLLQGMLSILLFAGALHVDLSELSASRRSVALLAFFGTLASTLAVGFALFGLLGLTGLALPLPWCLAFGALISPTDPIAVMGILKQAKAPPTLEVVISGESLFNDGVGVVLFALMASMIGQAHVPGPGQAALLLAREAGGGLLFGVGLGAVGLYLLRSIDSYQEEVTLTLALVLGGYALASHLHISGPLAMVAAGLIIGNHGRDVAMSDRTQKHLDSFWELLDFILNAVLFMFIGAQAILVPFGGHVLLGGLLAIAVTLAARFLSVGLPMRLLGARARMPQGSWQVLTWGGLRGGISIALALSLPAGAERQLVVALTYCVVVFSILVQGGSMGRLVRRWVPCA
ncbi:MAG: cation:proton antiporter [Telluria sp.]